MSGDPVRWLEGADDGSGAARELLRSAGRTPGMTAADDAALREGVARIAASPTAHPAAVKWLAAKGIGAVGAACAVVAVAAYVAASRPLAPRASAPVRAPRAAPGAEHGSRASVPAWARPSAAASATPRWQTSAATAHDAGRAADEQPEPVRVGITTAHRGVAGATLPPTASFAPARRLASPGAPRESVRSGATAVPPGVVRSHGLAPWFDSFLEARLIQHGRDLLQAGDPTGALRVADALEGQFAHSTQLEDRVSLAVRALIELGRIREGRARVDALLARRPGSQVGLRLRQVIERVELESPRSAAPSTPTATGAGSLAAETTLVARAQSLLASDPAGALRVADEHARTFARGALGEEREVIAIRALAALGRARDARARADAFALRWPASPLLPLVRATRDRLER